MEGARIYHFGLSGGPLFGGGRLWVVIRGNRVDMQLRWLETVFFFAYLVYLGPKQLMLGSADHHQISS